MLKLISRILVIIGGLNWGLIGAGSLLGSNWNVVGMIFSWSATVLSIVYLLVGLATIYLFFTRD